MSSGIRNVTDQAQQAALDQKKNLPGKILGGGCATFSQHDLRSWDTTWFAYWRWQAEYLMGRRERAIQIAGVHGPVCGDILRDARRRCDTGHRFGLS